MCAHVNFHDSRDVIRYFRDLFNLSKLLKNGLEYELAKFRKQLLEAGWSEDRINQFQCVATCGTVYEQYIPRPIRNRGDWKEYFKNRSRWRK